MGHRLDNGDVHAAGTGEADIHDMEQAIGTNNPGRKIIINNFVLLQKQRWD